MEENNSAELDLKVDQYKEPSPVVLYNATSADGFEILKRPFGELSWAGISAGPSIGFSIVGLAFLYSELSHFSHLAIGTIEVLYLVLAGHAPASVYFAHFLPPVLIGNLVGGVLIVAFLNHLQGAREQKKVVASGTVALELATT